MRKWAKIVPHVLAFRSFNGYPSTRQEQLELTHADVDSMRKTIVGSPLRYNHDDSTFIGIVGKDRICKDKSWDVRLDLCNKTPKGRRVIEYVQAGLLKGVSLKHFKSMNRVTPLEVSVCCRGARGSGSVMLSGDNDDTIVSASASALNNRMYFDSNTKLYTRDRCDGDIISATHKYTDADELIHVLEMSEADPSTTPPVANPASIPVIPTDATGTQAAPDASAVPGDPTEEEQAASRAALFPHTTGVLTSLADANDVPQAMKDQIATNMQQLEQSQLENAAKIQEMTAKAKESEALIASLRMAQKNVAEVAKFDAVVTRDRAEAAATAEPIVDQAEADLLTINSMNPRQTELMNRTKQQQETRKSTMNSVVFAKMNNWMAQTQKKRPAPSSQTTSVVAASWTHDPHNFADQKRQKIAENKKDYMYGDPLQYRPYEGIVAASGSIKEMDRHWAIEQSKGPFEPGSGANFNHAWMTEGQRNVFLEGERGYPHTTYTFGQGLSENALRLRKQFRKEPELIWADEQ